MTPNADYERVVEAANLLWSIMSECDGHRYGQARYDMTLDHIYDLADAARDRLLAQNDSSGTAR